MQTASRQATPTGPGIRVEGLGLRLGGTRVLEGLNFQVEPGSIHCLVGPNGGGKTSTLRCLLGQMPHTGRITFDWYGANRSVGYVPQLLELERSLPLTVENFLALASQDSPAFTGLRRDIRPAVDAALERVGLGAKRRYMVGGLSGGERQRLLFAQALIPLPALLVLDEPMTSMDEAGSRTFETLIRDLHREGTTVLWVNHDMALVRRMADALTVIDGAVLAHGPVAEVMNEALAQGDFHALRHAAAEAD